MLAISEVSKLLFFSLSLFIFSSFNDIQGFRCMTQLHILLCSTIVSTELFLYIFCHHHIITIAHRGRRLTQGQIHSSEQLWDSYRYHLPLRKWIALDNLKDNFFKKRKTIEELKPGSLQVGSSINNVWNACVSWC